MLFILGSCRSQKIGPNSSNYKSEAQKNNYSDIVSDKYKRNYIEELSSYRYLIDSLFKHQSEKSFFTTTPIEGNPKIKRIDLSEATINSNDNVKLVENYLSYNSRFPIRLGYGISRIDLTRSFLNAVDFDIEPIEGQGSIQTNFEAKIITDYSYLKEYLKIDYNASINLIGIGGGSLDANFTRDFTEINNGFYLVIKGETEFGRIGLKNIKIKDEAKQLAFENPAAFNSKYGYSFPIMQTHGASVFIIIKFKSVDRALIQNMFFKNSANFSIDIFSGSASLTLQYDLQKLMQKEETEIFVYSEGGESFKKISRILKSINDIKNNVKEKGKFTFDSVIVACADYLEDLSFEKSRPLGYNLITYSQLNLPVDSELEYPQKINFFERLKGIYNSNTSSIKTIDLLIQNPGVIKLFSEKYPSINLDTLKSIKKNIKVIQEYLLARYNYLKNQQGLQRDSFYVQGPAEFMPYKLPPELFISIESKKVEENKIVYTVKGNFLENIQMRAKLSFGGELFLTIYGVQGKNLKVTNYVKVLDNGSTVTIDSTLKIADSIIFKERIKTKIDLLEPPNEDLYEIDYDIFDYFNKHDKKKPLQKKAEVYATAYIYITAKNILGITEEKLIGKLVFDYEKGTTYLFEL